MFYILDDFERCEILSTFTNVEGKCVFFRIERRQGKICLRGFQPDPTQTRLYCRRRWLIENSLKFWLKRVEGLYCLDGVSPSACHCISIVVMYGSVTECRLGS